MGETKAHKLPVVPDSPAGAPNPPRRRETTLRTVVLTLSVCLASSVVLSISTVTLRPIREAHERREQKERVLELLASRPGLSQVMGDLSTASVEQWVVDLATGEKAADLDAATFNPQTAATDPKTGHDIPADRDLAKIRRQARHGVVTVLRREGAVEALVVPVYGQGYASIISASVALAKDGNTIQGIVVHSHEETPGIGSDIEDAKWQAQFVGKHVRADDGKVGLRMVADDTKPASDDGRFRVDAISGATGSSNGLGGALRFWLGDDGYGPFLARVREGALR